MKKVNLKGSAIRVKFKDQIDKEFGTGNFTKDQAKDSAQKAGLNETEYKSIYTHVLRHFKVDKNLFSFGDIPQEVKVVKAEKKKTLQSDLDIINEPVDAVAQKWEKKAQEAKAFFKKPAVVKKKAVT